MTSTISPPLSSRRVFLAGSVVSVSAAALHSLGCKFLTADIIVPILMSTAFSQLVDEAKRIFREQSFPRGSVLNERPRASASVQKGIDERTQNAFKNTNTRMDYATTICLNEHGQPRYMQLGRDGGGWSLVSGGGDGRAAFQVHDVWLAYLLDRDHCRLRVNGDSRFNERCGVRGCPALLTKQDVLDVRGESHTLQFPMRDVNPSAWAVHQREQHSPEWLDCAAELHGRPECPL